VLKITLWDDPVLKKIAEPVADSAFGPELEAFGQEMLETMKACGNGVGLAGPQVSVSNRIFVMKFPEDENRAPIVIVNPVIKLSGWLTYEREGCLSFPGIYEQVERNADVVMQYRNPIGEAMEIHLTKWDARVAQHEFDHLNGIMFFDRMSRQVRKRLLREWEETRGKRR
jgi:peptide deformylase